MCCVKLRLNGGKYGYSIVDLGRPSTAIQAPILPWSQSSKLKAHGERCASTNNVAQLNPSGCHSSCTGIYQLHPFNSCLFVGVRNRLIYISSSVDRRENRLRGIYIVSIEERVTARTNGKLVMAAWANCQVVHLGEIPKGLSRLSFRNGTWGSMAHALYIEAPCYTTGL